jgi:hypothetical protein
VERIDEHATDVAASPEAAWDAARDVLTHLGRSGVGARYGRLVGVSDPPFALVEEDRPSLLRVEGRHRFARYAIVARVDPAPGGSRLRLESLAAFPGPHGALYRLAVVGTRGHVVAVRRLLAVVRRRAERCATS